MRVELNENQLHWLHMMLHTEESNEAVEIMEELELAS